ncbi:ABC transporter ATP-binding protein [Nocardioides ginsengisoli]|uniref:ABC transporter ATP-binding protein n=1 Tax=Nocardioides ginsengisoli TaxID=363868 RepID=A0ABW3W735_9ACTN
MTDPLLTIEDLSVRLRTDVESRPILDGVSLTCGSGEIVGLVGESGSGKSVTLRATLGLLPGSAAAEGSIRVDGTEVLGARAADIHRVRAHTASMVFQDPRAHTNPIQRIGDFLTDGLRVVRGMSRRAANDVALGLLQEVGLPDPERHLRQYPHELSGGMLQRVMIATALAGEPRLLLADEPTTALDVTTQAEIVALLSRLRRDRGLSIVFVTHDLDLAVALCDRILVMYAGRVVESAPSSQLSLTPRHPYTAALFASRPTADRAELVAIPGRPLSLYDVPTGCAFAERCALADERCRTERPEEAGAAGNTVACHHAPALTPGGAR